MPIQYKERCRCVGSTDHPSRYLGHLLVKKKKKKMRLSGHFHADRKVDLLLMEFILPQRDSNVKEVTSVSEWRNGDTTLKLVYLTHSTES